MWRVEPIDGLYYCFDPAWKREGSVHPQGANWPPAQDDNRDLGTAQTMCDVFNARDHPKEFAKCG